MSERKQKQKQKRSRRVRRLVRLKQVKFSTVSPKTEVQIAAATYVDASTVVVVAPRRASAHVAHVAVSNDGVTFTSLPAVRAGGAGTYLDFEFVGSAPWGPWRLDNATVSGNGNALIEIRRTGGRLADGVTEGSDFHASDFLFCASGTSLRRVHSHFSPVAFLGAKDGAADTDKTMSVAAGVSDAYARFIQSDTTYEVAAADDAGVVKWKWRKWAKGMFPGGTFSELNAFTTSAVELEYGVRVTFASTAGKAATDVWRFDAVTKNPRAARGEYLSPQRVSCPLPPPDPSGNDLDASKAGTQVELKVSYRGEHSFSAVTFTDAAGVKTVTGDPAPLGEITEALDFDDDVKLYAEGYFDGPEEYTFELEMTSASAFKWRKYRVGDAACKTTTTAPWCAWGGSGTVSVVHRVHLAHGVYVRFASLTGKAAGDRWRFDAYTFWSTTLSPVTVATQAATTSDDDALMYAEGAFFGDVDETFEVEIMSDTGTFRWRAFFATTDGSGVAWTEDVPVASSATLLRDGVSVHWLTALGKTFGDKWTFTAFAGHVVTALSKSRVGDAVPSPSNAAGDARVPTVTGVYLGAERARIRIEIGGTCTTSCSEFKWIKETPSVASPQNAHEAAATTWSGGTFTALIPMQSLEQPLVDGVNVTWGPTSGYKVGNTYTIDLAPMPTSVLPARPTPDPFFDPIGARSTYHDGAGAAPARDAVLTVEFTSGAAFKWRKDTGPYSSSVDVDADEPVTLGDTGVNLTFSAASGYVAGTRFLVPLRTHIPHVHNVTTTHGGSKSASAISRPVAAAANYANLPNQGSTLSDVLPMPGNVGSHAIHAYPAAGSLSGGGSAVPAVGYANQGGVGLSNIINAVPTHGYLAAVYPTAYLKIVGAAAVSPVSGVLADELTVSGTYTGDSSYVYQLEPHGTTSQFRWRKYALGSSEADAGSWTTANAVVTGSSSTTIEFGLSATFLSSTYAVGSVNRWTFTANKGHTFVYRDSGRALWSDEVVITGGVQPLSSGVSVRFSKVSGYAPGDQFAIRNRTVDSFGTYLGAADATFELDVLDRAEFDPPVFHRASGSTTAGLQADMTVTGAYAGRSTYVYEIKIDSASSGAQSTFKWRKYLRGRSDGGGPFGSAALPVSLSPTLLDDGTYVQWAAISGHAVNDRWTVIAHAGDAFRWRKDGGDWTTPQSMTSVGLVERDFSNVGTSKTVNVDVRATGEYSGAADATIALEVLPGGATFRWKKHAYMPRAGSLNQTSTAGAYCCGTEDVMLDSLTDAARGVGTWSPEMNMVPEPILLTEGVYVAFVSSSGYTAGDLYYVPVKKTAHHRLSDGVVVAFGADSGYSPNDRWNVSAAAGVYARGPLSGDTELSIMGSGFLPSESLKCRLSDERTLVSSVVDARYVSPNHVVCATPEHPPDTVADPVFVGAGSSAMETKGAYAWSYSVTFSVRMASATTFQWRADPLGETTGSWSGSAAIEVGTLRPLGDSGVFVAFASGETYGVGDEWTFAAYSRDDAINNVELTDIQLGSIRPGVMKHVAVSNDGGVSWSADKHGATRFLYSDIYVSPSGDDVTGDGTSSTPYRTIQRGIHAALSPGGGYVKNATNRDYIVVSPGRYTGAGNTGLFTMGKSVMVRAARSGEVVIYCAVRVAGAAHFGETMASAEGAGKVSLVGVNVENCGM